MAFFRSLVIEAKIFQFSVSSFGVVTLTEKNRNLQSFIRFGRDVVLWLSNLFGKLDSKDFPERFNESSRAFLAQRRSNKSGRYMALFEFGERRRRGVVMIPEGKSGGGWQSFGNICEELLSAINVLRSKRVVRAVASIKEGISFADMARSSTPEKRMETVGRKEFCVESSGSAAGFENVVWKQLLKLKDEVDGLIGLVKKRKVALGFDDGPWRGLSCTTCGLKMGSQNSEGLANISGGKSGLGSGPFLGQLEEILGCKEKGKSSGPEDWPAHPTHPTHGPESLVGFETHSTHPTHPTHPTHEPIRRQPPSSDLHHRSSEVGQSATPAIGVPPAILSGVSEMTSGDLPAPEMTRNASGLLETPSIGFSSREEADLADGMSQRGLPMGEVSEMTSGDLSAPEMTRNASGLLETPSIDFSTTEEADLAVGMSQRGLVSVESSNAELEVGEFLGDSEKEVVNVDPLAVCFPSDKMEGSKELGGSDWVLDMVPSFRHLVGVSCEGHEKELRELFVALEKDRVQSSLKKPAKSGKKLVRELKGLNSSINYEGSSIARKNKNEGRALLLIK